MSNAKERNRKCIGKDILKQTVKQGGIRKKTVPCKSNFSRNKSIREWVIEEQPKETNFSFGFDARLLLYFHMLITSEQLFRVGNDEKKNGFKNGLPRLLLQNK